MTADTAPIPPHVSQICLVAPNILAISIETGKVTRPRSQPYTAQPDDKIEMRDGGATSLLIRAGQEIGEIVGAASKRELIYHWSYSGETLKTDIADNAATYTITNANDAAYAAGAHPTEVHRKTKPIDWLPGASIIPARHVLFLTLPSKLKEGQSYQIDCGSLNLAASRISFTNNTRKTNSLAVHTNQIGYRADDPFKRGYLSIWLGPLAADPKAGAFTYPAGLRFHLLEDATGADLFTGSVEMAKSSTDKEKMYREMNFNGTDVLRMDFSAFNRPGRYRLYVEGIGCGYPFEIGPSTWSHAFRVQMRGFYNQRSGIALGPPYTTFVKPRDHHPADGVPIFRSNWAASIWKDESNVGQALKKQATTEPVTNGWGGYMDAGDWNPRRVTHMRATLAQLEIADLFPEYISKLKLNIPQDYKVPDLLNEALFEIDCFRRMQTPEGGIGYGLETDGDPAVYGVSWSPKVLPVYMASPDAGSSWYYAAAAARAARLIKPHDASLAATYAQSASRAMNYAEAELVKQCAATGKTADAILWTASDSRNLAAIEMLRLTGDKHWHDVFLQNSVLVRDNPDLYQWGKAAQVDAAFAYAIADQKLTDPQLRQHAIAGLEKLAQFAIGFSHGNAFDIVSQEQWRPMFMGFYSTPLGGRAALRAYHLTGKNEYLELGVRACQFSSGANPDNLVFTTGLGANPVRNALKLDAQSTGQPVPEGITVYGIEDHINFPSTWGYWILPSLNGVMSPQYAQWPLTESYTDTLFFIPVNEFTVDIWDENAWVWGYLAARPAK